MLRKVVNHRLNPFTAANTHAVITDEVHAIPASGTYWARLFEAPDSTYVHATSGSPLYIRTVGGTVFSEVSSSPGLNEFRVDYTYKTGWIEFNSGNADDIILCCYRGTGSVVTAELVNALQWLRPVAPFFAGDASDSDLTVSSNTALTESPASSLIAFKQYDNLTINSSIELSLNSAANGMIITVAGLLTMNSSASISVSGNGGAGGVATGAGTSGQGGEGAFGGGGGAGGSGGAGGDGGTTPIEPFSIGRGVSGAGGAQGANNGAAGVAHDIISPTDHYWKELTNLMLYGAGGGAGGGNGTDGHYGGAGSGFLIINCNVLSVATGAMFDASGGNGQSTGVNGRGGAGGGAGGVAVIAANQIVGDTAANVEANMVDVSGGAGSTCDEGAGGTGGNGADGYKRVIELHEYNVF